MLKPATLGIDSYTIVLADLKKRGASRSRKVEILKTTMRAVLKNAKHQNFTYGYAAGNSYQTLSG